MQISSIGLGTWAIGGHMWGGQDDARKPRGDRRGARPWHQLDRHGADLRIGSCRDHRRPRASKGSRMTRRPLVFTKFGLGHRCRRAIALRRAGTEVAGRMRAQSRAARRRAHRSVSIALAGAATHPRNRRRVCELLEAGKVRAIGVSNFSVAQLEAWRATGVPVLSLQSPFSILRPAIEPTSCRGVPRTVSGVIAYSPLFRGHVVRHLDDETRHSRPATGAARTRTIRERRFQRAPPGARRDQEPCSSPGTQLRPALHRRAAAVPGLTGCIVGSRDARQSSVMANLGVAVSLEQARCGMGDCAALAERPADDRVGDERSDSAFVLGDVWPPRCLRGRQIDAPAARGGAEQAATAVEHADNRRPVLLGGLETQTLDVHVPAARAGVDVERRVRGRCPPGCFRPTCARRRCGPSGRRSRP